MRGEPWVVGGGAVKFVTVDDTVWAGLPERHEAGSPNTLGIVALGVACDALSEIGMDAIAAWEKSLTKRLRKGIADIPGLRLLKLWPETVIDRVGVATFVSESFSDRLLAQILAAEYAIGVRSGRFCSHPLVTSLLNMREEEAAAIRRDVLAGDEKRMPGAVRASIGLASSTEDVDRLLDALSVVTECWPRVSLLLRSRRRRVSTDGRSSEVADVSVSASFSDARPKLRFQLTVYPSDQQPRPRTCRAASHKEGEPIGH